MKTVVRKLSSSANEPDEDAIYDAFFISDGAVWMVSIDDDKFSHTHDSVGHAFPCDTDDLTELYHAIARALFEAGEQA